MEFPSYIAGQVAELVGIDPEKLRLWRQRGHLPTKSEPGWTRYNYADVIGLACLLELTKMGVGVSHAADMLNRHDIRGRLLSEHSHTDAETPFEDSVIVIAPVTVEGGGQSYEFVFCSLSELPMVFINKANGRYLPGCPCLIVLNLSDVRRRVDTKIKAQ